MAKRTIREKEVMDHLQREGFKEIKDTTKLTKWYKEASERPSCLKSLHKKKINK